MTVCAETWGWSRKRAEIGMSLLISRTGKTENGIYKALRRLKKPAADGGWGMLTVVGGGPPPKPLIYQIQKDWELWAWKTEAELVAARMKLQHYARMGRKHNAGPLPASGVALARMLREHALLIAPAMGAPPADKGNHRWRRWALTMHELEQRSSMNIVRQVIAWIHNDETWRGRVKGLSADQDLKSHFEILCALALR